MKIPFTIITMAANITEVFIKSHLLLSDIHRAEKSDLFVQLSLVNLTLEHLHKQTSDKSKRGYG